MAASCLRVLIMARRISKPDVLLIAALLLLGAAGLIFVNVWKGQEGSGVRITVDGAVYGVYDLSKEQTIPINVRGAVTNVLQTADGKAKMIQAECPDKLCVRQNAAYRKGETIVCLPNKVAVEITGGQEGTVDAVSQ